ncbi:MAG: hypothetical protein IRZ07_18690 [Microbispora sp.]|nr:hypothetical protein [Microbispora sp.]
MATLVEALREVGMPPAAAADVFTSYVNGFTIEEQNRKLGQPKRDLGFEFGLALLLDGLRSRAATGA